jgi:hypothetical protein
MEGSGSVAATAPSAATAENGGGGSNRGPLQRHQHRVNIIEPDLEEQADRPPALSTREMQARAARTKRLAERRVSTGPMANDYRKSDFIPEINVRPMVTCSSISSSRPGSQGGFTKSKNRCKHCFDTCVKKSRIK